MRKQNTSLGSKIDELSRKVEDSSIDERVSTLEGYVFELEAKIKEDILEWDVQKEVWRREVDMYEEVIKNLEHQLAYK